MMSLLFDDDYILDAYARDIQRDTEKRTKKQMAREIAERMLRAGEPLEKIAEYVPSLSTEEIQELASQTV